MIVEGDDLVTPLGDGLSLFLIFGSNDGVVVRGSVAEDPGVVLFVEEVGLHIDSLNRLLSAVRESEIVLVEVIEEGFLGGRAGVSRVYEALILLVVGLRGSFGLHSAD